MSLLPGAVPFEVYRRVFDDIPDCVALTRLDDGLYIDVNPGFQRFTGYHRDEVLNQSSIGVGIWARPEDRLGYVAALARDGACHAYPCLLRKRDGSVREVEMSGSVIDYEGNYILISVVTDVTERNQTQAELAHHRAHLEQRVAERTQALVAANEALALTHKRLLASERQARHQAQHDPLTGLPNRALLADRLEQGIARAERGQDGLAMLLVDLDNFRRINETLGQHTGDDVLRGVAQRLRGLLRKADTVARLGGDQFVVALGGAQAGQHAAVVAQKVLDSLSQPLPTPHGPVVPRGRIGVAVYPADGHDVDALLRAADTALEKAKATGGRQVQFHCPEMQQAARQRLALEAELRVALADGQFCLHYQPQVDMRTGQVLALEALVRWQHPVRGLVPPLDFIPLAEDTGLIVPLGEWVLRQATLQLGRWRAAGHADLRVAVNLSPRQIWAPGFMDMVRQALAEARLPGDALDVEITESLLIQPTAENVNTFEDLAELGMHLYIDDFGTGYSSLSYLKSYPIHALKIDRAFVRHITDNARDLAITSTIIAMARHLQLQVIAEGVETAEQAERLLQHGCTLGQGWHFGKPMPAEAVDALLARQAAQAAAQWPDARRAAQIGAVVRAAAS